MPCRDGNGDVFNGTLTLVFVMMPALKGLLEDIYTQLTWKPSRDQKERPAWQFYHHLPVVSLLMHLRLFKKLTEKTEEKERLEKALKIAIEVNAAVLGADKIANDGTEEVTNVNALLKECKKEKVYVVKTAFPIEVLPLSFCF